MVHHIENEDIFRSTADALVNPVNCRGVMGKGIALEFKKRFPEIMPIYKEACKKKKLVPGKLMFIRIIAELTANEDLFEEGLAKRPAIILFPTKDHWRDKSKIEWIEAGLIELKKNYKEWGLNSISMPKIGCGLGGLAWEDVKVLIENHFSYEPVEIHVYISDKK